VKTKVKNKCPKCGKKLTAAFDITDLEAKPSKGDFSICIDCESFLVFDKKLKLRIADLKSISNEMMNEMVKNRFLLRKFKEEYRKYN